MQALLSVDDYFIEELSIRTNPDYDPEKAAEGDVLISFDIKRKSSEPRFMISMLIDVNKSKKTLSCAAYRVSLRIGGFFSFPERTAEETINKMIGLNGLSILYGLARGTVAQVTATCPHGKFVLPSLNFIELLKKKAQASAKSSRKKTAKV